MSIVLFSQRLYFFFRCCCSIFTFYVFSLFVRRAVLSFLLPFFYSFSLFLLIFCFICLSYPFSSFSSFFSFFAFFHQVFCNIIRHDNKCIKIFFYKIKHCTFTTANAPGYSYHFHNSFTENYVLNVLQASYSPVSYQFQAEQTA